MFGPFIVFRILKIFILEMIYYSLHFIIAYFHYGRVLCGYLFFLFKISLPFPYDEIFTLCLSVNLSAFAYLPRGKIFTIGSTFNARVDHCLP